MDKDVFVQNVKHYCSLRGIKPTIACKESGAGKDLINQIETRGSIPSVEKIQKLADYLGVTTSELLGEKKNYALIDITHEFPFQNSLDDLYTALESAGPHLSDTLRTHIEALSKSREIAMPLSVWLYGQVRSLESVEVEENPERMSLPHTPYNFVDDDERKMLYFYQLADKQTKENLVKLLCSVIEPQTGVPETTFPFETAPAGTGKLNHIYRTLNEEGQEKLLDYAVDLEASGRYIKSNPAEMGEEKNA